MLKDFILPDIGEGIVECEIVEWLVKEGDHIEEDQAVVELMTDKAVVQIPAAESGTVVKFHYQQGEIAKVHTALFSIETEAMGSQSTGPVAQAPSPPAASPVSEAQTVPSSVGEAVSAKSVAPKKPLATPAVRKLARELEIDLRQVSGSGKNGRILKADLAKYQPEQLPGLPVEAHLPATAGGRIEPLKGVKLVMARRMSESAATIPHFGYGEEIDLTRLMALRNQLKGPLAKSGVKLTLMSFFMKALELAVREHPLLNSRLNAEVSEIVYQEHCHIGMAVDTSIGLLVPNVKNVQKRTILEIAQEVHRLTEAARAGKVDPADMQGGTITISNIGTVGGVYGIPIINPPEVAVVALGKAQPLPRYNSAGALESRQLMQAHWSADHRLIDGGTMARFCNTWKNFLENPDMMLIHLT